MLPLVISTPGISSFPRFLSLTPHLFAFLIFSSLSFLFPLNILSLSKFLPSFLLLLQSPLSSSHFPPPSFFLPFSAAAKTLQFCASYWICASCSFRFIHYFFLKLFFQFRDSSFLSLRSCFFLVVFFFVTTKSIGVVSLLLLSPGMKLLESVFVTLVFSDSVCV